LPILSGVPTLEVDRETENGSDETSVLLRDCFVAGCDYTYGVGVTVRGSNSLLRADATTQVTYCKTGILVGTGGAIYGSPRLIYGPTGDPILFEGAGSASSVHRDVWYENQRFVGNDDWAARPFLQTLSQEGGTGTWFSVNYDGGMGWYDGSGYGIDTTLYRSAANLLKTDDSFELPGTYLLPLKLGTYRLWVNPGDGKLYIKDGAPANATDGTIVGSQ
jgi:hypothetical protein